MPHTVLGFVPRFANPKGIEEQAAALRWKPRPAIPLKTSRNHFFGKRRRRAALQSGLEIQPCARARAGSYLEARLEARF